MPAFGMQKGLWKPQGHPPGKLSCPSGPKQHLSSRVSRTERGFMRNYERCLPTVHIQK